MRRQRARAAQIAVAPYFLNSWTAPQTAAAIASGKIVPRARQALLWQAKKMTKAVGGERYLNFREALARLRHH